MINSVSAQKRKNKRKKITYVIIFLCFSFLVLRSCIIQCSLLVSYNNRINKIEKQIEIEKNRKKEIEAYKQYTNTREYKESIARNKLGLAYPNEIILKPE